MDFWAVGDKVGFLRFGCWFDFCIEGGGWIFAAQVVVELLRFGCWLQLDFCIAGAGWTTFFFLLCEFLLFLRCEWWYVFCIAAGAWFYFWVVCHPSFFAMWLFVKFSSCLGLFYFSVVDVLNLTIIHMWFDVKRNYPTHILSSLYLNLKISYRWRRRSAGNNYSGGLSVWAVTVSKMHFARAVKFNLIRESSNNLKQD